MFFAAVMLKTHAGPLCRQHRDLPRRRSKYRSCARIYLFLAATSAGGSRFRTDRRESQRSHYNLLRNAERFRDNLETSALDGTQRRNHNSRPRRGGGKKPAKKRMEALFCFVFSTEPKKKGGSYGGTFFQRPPRPPPPSPPPPPSSL